MGLLQSQPNLTRFLASSYFTLHLSLSLFTTLHKSHPIYIYNFQGWKSWQKPKLKHYGLIIYCSQVCICLCLLPPLEINPCLTPLTYILTLTLFHSINTHTPTLFSLFSLNRNISISFSWITSVLLYFLSLDNREEFVVS